MMRALVLVALASTAAAADPVHYEQVRFDAGLTGSTVAIADRNGTGFVVEIKELVNDHLAIGGRVEIGVMYGGHVGTDNASVSVTLAACGLVKGEYHFLDGQIRPFVGFGVGAYTIGGETVDSGPMTAAISTETGRYIGVAPQLGVDLGKVRVAATYNAIFGASLADRSQNYLSLELAYEFAGGRRPTP